MATMVGLCGLEIPKACEGINHAHYVRGKKDACDAAAVIQSITPFGEWDRQSGGREYRGLRTARHTYVRDLNGPWLLFDNLKDPYQTTNLVGVRSAAELQERLEALLNRKLKERRDEFLSGQEYIAKWGYKVNASGTMPYKK